MGIVHTEGEHNNEQGEEDCSWQFYVSPRSMHKPATIDHIIETIHLLRSQYDNEVIFLLGGDFNHLNINSILDSYGALKQCMTTPTRNQAILEIILSDISNKYHPTTTLAPLQVDSDKKGSDTQTVTTTLWCLLHKQMQIIDWKELKNLSMLMTK